MNKKGFTLVELLAVIAILAILVIIALPNVLKMYNDSKKNAFMTEAQNLAKEVSSKYISESMKGNKIAVISNKQNPLDMTGRELEYNFELDSQGKIKSMWVSNGKYCISTNKDYTKITRNDISDKCSSKDANKIAGTLTKRFYEESGKTDRSLVSSIVFYSDGRTVSGAESYDVSEKKDGSIKMYVSQNTEYTSLLDLTIVANGKIALPEDSSNLFSFYYVSRGPSSNLKTIEFNDSVGTSNVKNMKGMFTLNNVTKYDLSSFDTSSVTNMSEMFEVYNFDELIEFNLNSFNTSKVTDMSNIFKKVHANVLDLSSFDTSNVTDMNRMFVESDIAEIKGLSKFNTSKVTNMKSMFFNSTTTNLNLTSFDTAKVIDMRDMFAGSKATTLDLSSFDTSNVTNMDGMFSSSKATEIKGLNKFNTSKVTDMNGMFYGSKATVLDLSSFNTSNVTNMSYMFYNSAATTLDLSSFDPSKVTNMSNMFNSSKATTGYARTQAAADKFNNSSGKPSGLTFTVK